MVVNDIIENQEFDLESVYVVENIISKVKDFLQDSRWSRTVILADEFCKFEQTVNEENKDYISRFSILETKLRNEKVGINSTFMAAILLNKSKIVQSEKNNILANFDLESENPDELLKRIKKKIRDIDATKRTAVKETLYEGQGGKYRGRSNSKFRGNDYRSKSQFREEGNRSNSRNRGEWKQKDGNRSGNWTRNGDHRSRSKSRGRNGNYGNQRFSSGDRRKNFQNSRSNSTDRKPEPKRTYKCDKFNINTDKSIFENKVENRAVLDSGCPEMVGGIAWLKTYEHSLGKELPRLNKVDYFKFGDTVYKTEMYVRLPLELGSLQEYVEVGIVKANVPLLISKMKLKEWGGIIDFSENTLHLKATNETIKLKETESGHLSVNVGKTIENNREEVVHEILLIKKKKEYSMMKLKKLHRIFGHPCHEKMELLMKDSGECDKIILKMLKKIQEKCRVCLKFKRKASKPKVGFAKAREVNETVSVDLKPVSSLTGDQKDGRQIVYIIDELSRFTAAGISKNKEAEEVVKIILNKWCLGMMGYPSRSFFADNGTEFKGKTLEHLSRRLGVKVELSPSYSPWSNGGNERRHGAVNLTVKKLMEEDRSLKLDDALQHAIWARNMEIGRLGKSPYQVVFGKSPALPGFSDGNVLTDSVVTESDALRMHFERQEKVRVLYRQADSSRRLKDAEKSRIQPFHDQKYEKGDLIMFLDKDDQWDGPAVVQGTESKTIFVSHNGTMKKVASCRARPWYDDIDQGDLLDDSNDESEIVIDCDETINLESDQFTDIEEFIDTDEEQVLEEKQEVVDRTGIETETQEHSDENRGEERRLKRFKSIEF